MYSCPLFNFGLQKGYQTEDLFSGKSHIFTCVGRLHRLFQCGYATDNREESVNSGGVAFHGILFYPTGKSQYFHTVFLRKPGYAHGAFPMAV